MKYVRRLSTNFQNFCNERISVWKFFHARGTHADLQLCPRVLMCPFYISLKRISNIFITYRYCYISDTKWTYKHARALIATHNKQNTQTIKSNQFYFKIEYAWLMRIRAKILLFSIHKTCSLKTKTIEFVFGALTRVFLAANQFVTNNFASLFMTQPLRRFLELMMMLLASFYSG